MKKPISIFLALLLTLSLLPLSVLAQGIEEMTSPEEQDAARTTEAAETESETAAAESEETEDPEDALSLPLDSAGSGSCGEGVTWSLANGTLTISGTGDMASCSAGGAPWYSSRTAITAVKLESGVASIGDYAFFGCSALTSVTIPSGVASIGEGAFDGCSALADVYFAGMRNDWNGMTVGEQNNCLTNTSLHYTPTPQRAADGLVELVDDTSLDAAECLEEVKKIDKLTLQTALQKFAAAVKALMALEPDGGVDITNDTKVSVTDITGAGMNASGTGAVTLTVRDGTETELPDTLNSEHPVYYLDMELSGVTNTGALDVPVCVSFAVPDGMIWQRVRLVHLVGADPDVLVPSSYEEDGKHYARFVLDGFSPYALAERERIPGDVDESGAVDIADVMHLLKCVAGVTGVTLADDQGNVNGDDALNIADVMHLLKYVAGVTGVNIY